MRGIVSAFMLLLLAWSCGPEATDATEAAALPDTVTYAAHVAPILWANCLPCHRPGHAGPFPLVTYREAQRKAQMIKLATGKGYMPPWPADTTYSRFLGERALTRTQIALLARWADQGAPVGDTTLLPPPPTLPEDPLLGDPDHVVWLPDTFRIHGDARDRFVIAKAPFALARDTFLRAVAFVPGNRQLVHHMNAALVVYPEGARRDVFAGAHYIDAEQRGSLDAFQELQLANDDGSWPPLVPSVVNHLPGLGPLVLPEGIGGLHLKRQGAFLLNTLHYGPSARDTTDRSRFLLWFAPGPPERPLQELSLGSTHTPIDPPLHLEPGAVRSFHTQLTLRKAISVVTVNPHMHLLGTSFVAYAVTPARDTVPLVRIPQWDFKWQYAYTFPKLLPLPAGTTLHVHGTFDNTAANPNQPHAPPRPITGTDSRFMRTTDEMLQFFVTYVDQRPGDEKIGLGTK